MILGVDEVGRGPWAGPLVVGAVVLGDAAIEGLTDSKKLTKKRREELYDKIYAQAAAVGLGWVSAGEIDECGLSEALRLATRRAVKEIKTPFHEIIIDGTINFLKETPLESYVTTLKKADLLIPAVSAASIVAKVARDRYMAEQDRVYPGFGFSSHVGYGTAKHRQVIAAYGVTPLHRLSFAPLTAYRKNEATVSVVSKTTKAIGDRAEEAVSKYLQSKGHEVLERNWRTCWCEIDIVSLLDSTLYFTEVKYRKNAEHGDGLSVITPKKVQQMKFAAEFYMHSHSARQCDAQLAAASVGADYALDEWFPLT